MNEEKSYIPTIDAGDHKETRKWIRFILDHYKADFDRVDQGERYKWEAVRWYQQHWDPDAPDFTAMLKKAFSKAGNLLTGGPNSLSYAQICQFSAIDPLLIKNAFATLYDETQPLAHRIASFQKASKDLCELLAKRTPDKKQTSFQDLHAISVYLFFAYPQTYYIYKFRSCRNFATRTNFGDPFSLKLPEAKKLENLAELCQLVLEELCKDSELLSLHQNRLDETCYDDPGLHLLATDIIFYGGAYMESYQFNTGDQYWPSPKEYDPGLSADDWVRILQDPAITTPEVLLLFNTLLQTDGECSEPRLSACLNRIFDHKAVLQDFAEKVTCAPCPKDFEPFAKYIIPFIVRTITEGENQCTSWRLRSELRNALELLDDFWPSLSEYDPELSKEDWKAYILSVELPEHPKPMQMLKALMEQNGQASCKQLSEIYGGTVSRYVGCAVNLGRHAKKYFSLPSCMDGDQERFFPIPFRGKLCTENGVECYAYRIRPELYAALSEIDLSGISPYVTDEKDDVMNIDVNTILYGPPGTGKTYHTVIYAVAIIEQKDWESIAAEDYETVLKRYNTYKSQGRIAFTTFHQSYGYEEFIEGIKPLVSDDDDGNDGTIQYRVLPGVFKHFCEQAANPASASTDFDALSIRKNPVIWKVSLWSTGDNEIRTECLENGHIRIGWDQYGKDLTDATDFSADGGRVVLNAFINKMQVGDIVLSCYSASTIDAIGVVTGEYEWHEEYDSLRRVRKVNWIAKNIRENILEMNKGKSLTLASIYQLSNIALSDVFDMIRKYSQGQASVPNRNLNYVFIIDEINRGNISKIFGELITLIEPSKRIGRPEGMQTVLPYSMSPFGVPENVYIIGTMNTADRSIATIDTALRRRFTFREMLPEPAVLKGITVDGISIPKLLDILNRRITVLYDREHTIGHAYFTRLQDDNQITVLADIFKNKIIPLLQEYFYEDYSKICLVLGDNQKSDDTLRFIRAERIDQAGLFGNTELDLGSEFTYSINESAFQNPEAYRQIYE